MCERESFSIDFNDRFDFLRPSAPIIDPPEIRIYLAGALTNTDVATQAECRSIRGAVKYALDGYDYLGARFNVYDPAEITAPGSSHTAEEVYATDHRCTVCSDLVIFHVNVPSLGVGIEAQLSALATTPRIVICKANMCQSRMFSGICASTIAEIFYDTPFDVVQQLESLRPTISPLIIESAERRRPHLSAIVQQRLGEKFLMQRIRMGVSIGRLAKESDIPPYWIREVERCPEFGSTLGCMQIFRIAEVLNCYAKLHQGQFQIVDKNDTLGPAERESLENLAKFVNRCTSVSEDRVFKVWGQYLKEESRQLEDATAFRGGENIPHVLTSEEWQTRYDNVGFF